jgi:hypothetical protein
VLRLAVVPAVWLAFIPLVIDAGRDPGFVLPEDIGPYPLWHVVGVILLLAVESWFLFVMLRPSTYRLTEWRRPLKVLGLVFIAFFFEPMVTDMPGYVYVNTGFLFTWFVILAALVVVGILASRVWPARVTDV